MRGIPKSLHFIRPPKLKDIQPITLFNHKVWETQIEQFEHGLTLSNESFKNHPKFIDKQKRIEKDEICDFFKVKYFGKM